MIFTTGTYRKPAASAVDKLRYVCNKNNVISICERSAAAANHKLVHTWNKNVEGMRLLVYIC